MLVKRFLLFLVGVVLLPLCWGLCRAIFDLFPLAAINTPPWIAPSLLALCAGYACWTIIYLCLSPSIRLYIWGHELTHALWGTLAGAKVGPIRVNRAGGSVTLSEAGILTTLAPYFVPFYTLIVILLRLLLGLFIARGRWELVWLFLVGLTWSFHMTYTARSLLQQQPDLHAYGRLFSYTLIITVNLLTLGYVLVFASAATLPLFHEQIFTRTARVYRDLAVALHDGAKFTTQRAQSWRKPAQ